jgi:iron complex outermembrane recepter protein
MTMMTFSLHNSARNGHRIRAGLLASAAGAMVLSLAAPAHAQAVSAEEEAGLGDEVIIVTARKQDETLQQVPVTVTVLGKGTLDNFNVDQVADVVSRVPTLNVQVGGSGSGGQISLRGVGSSNISAAFDSAVAFDFDGVQVSSMRLVQPGFFDTAQIEILKGPQSLYFGKSASAGVFSIKSANPTSTWQVGGKASYELEEKGYVIGGYVSGPVTDTLGIRLAAQYNDIKEYQKLQAGTPAVNQRRGLTDFVTRATLAWEPTSEFRANLKLQYSRNENDGAIGTAEISCGANGRADEIFLLQGALAIPAGYNCNVKDQRYFLPDTAPALAGKVPGPSKAVGYNGVPFGETTVFFGRLRFDVELPSSLTFTSVSGYLDLDAVDVDNYSYGGIGPYFSPLGVPVAAVAPAAAATNGVGVPGGVGTSDPINGLKQFSQEFRLSSDFDGAFNFMLGTFYENRKYIFDTSQQAINISLIAPDPVTGNTFDYDKTHTTKTDAWSVFGSGTVEFSDQLELSGGVRYTSEKKVQTIRIPYVHTFLSSGPAFVSSGFFSGPITFRDNNFSPEATIKYQATPDVNIFASFKTGFKSGGIDNSALPSNSLAGFASADPLVRAATAEALKFGSERAIGGEIGVKSQFADRAFTLNATLYYYIFKDLQVQNFNATTIQFVTLNAGEVTTKGLDINWGWNTPLDGLSFSGNLAYLDAKYSAAFVQPGLDGRFGTPDDIDIDGRRVSQAPKFAGNFAFDWSVPLGDSLKLGLNGNAAYNDGYLTDESTLNDFKQKSFVTLDGSISVGDPDGKWKLSLVGLNLTDRIYVITSGPRPFLAPPGAAGRGLPQGDDLVLTQNRGRQVFVEASFRF